MKSDPAYRFRTDIEGLRGLAVLLVVLFHIEVSVFSGGYVGVDVFFVISGYLITSLMFREFQDTGQIDVAAFFSRRIRRLLPASFFTVFGTVLIGWIVLSPLALEELLQDAFAATTYSANFRLLGQSTDYLRSQSSPSVFQHYWSLAVEEQFYLLWPFLIAGLFKLRFTRQMVGVSLLALIFGSFWLSVNVSGQNQPWAFFMLPTRAWEMGVGAVLACFGNRVIKVDEKIRHIFGFLGLLGIIAPAVMFNEFTLYPSWRAAFPVAGTFMIIASVGSGITGLFNSYFFTKLGKYSYSWYLWHWPLIAFVRKWSDEKYGFLLRVCAAVTAFVVAVISARFIEAPFKKLIFFVKSPKKAILFGASLTCLSVAVLFLAFQIRPRLNIPISSPPVQSSDSLPSAKSPFPEASKDSLPVRSSTTLPQFSSPAITAAPVEGSEGRVPFIGSTDLESHYELIAKGAELEIFPLAADFGGLDPRIYGSGCHLGVEKTKSPPCVYGDESANRTMVLFGDSHAASWFPLFDLIGEEDGWRLSSRTKTSCFIEDIEFSLSGTDRQYSECMEWKEWVYAELSESSVDLILVATLRKDVQEEFLSPKEWEQGLIATLAKLQSLNSGDVVLLGSTPLFEEHVRECVASNLENLDRCHGEREKVAPFEYAQMEQHAADEAGVVYVPTIDLICAESLCPVVIGNNVVFRDTGHLTSDFVISLREFITADLSSKGIELSEEIE